jgi:hypothetical protein
MMRRGRLARRAQSLLARNIPIETKVTQSIKLIAKIKFQRTCTSDYSLILSVLIYNNGMEIVVCKGVVQTITVGFCTWDYF